MYEHMKDAVEVFSHLYINPDAKDVVIPEQSESM